jgi:hypothetical protein
MSRGGLGAEIAYLKTPSGFEISLPGRILARLTPEKQRNRSSMHLGQGRSRGLSQALPGAGLGREAVQKPLR